MRKVGRPRGSPLTSVLSVRVTPQTHKKVWDAARLNNHTASREVEMRLKHSLLKYPRLKIVVVETIKEQDEMETVREQSE